MRPVPPKPVPSLGLQELHEHPCVYLRLAHLQGAPSWQHLAPDDHYHLFYLKRLAELGASWVAALNATSPEEVFLQKVWSSDSLPIAALTWRPPCRGPQQRCARCLLVAGQSVVGRGFEPSLGSGRRCTAGKKTLTIFHDNPCFHVTLIISTRSPTNFLVAVIYNSTYHFLELTWTRKPISSVWSLNYLIPWRGKKWLCRPDILLTEQQGLNAQCRLIPIHILEL